MEHIGTGPVSLQLREIIRAQIEEGIYPPGTAIPPENELAAQYDVNRLTVRTAIGALVYEGLLKRVQGKGVYVLGEKMNRDLDNLGGFTQTIRQKTRCPPPESSPRRFARRGTSMRWSSGFSRKTPSITSSVSAM